MSMGKILVVDDDPSILEVIKIILEGANYQVIVNSRPAETIRKVEEEKPDLLLMDIWMSGVDGTDIAKQIRADDKLSSMPIILISAKQDAEKSIGKIADDYIEKPFDMDDLLSRVEKLLKRT